ncbi:unnamed protein product [Paramecium pentaurelia]|uniref:Uncharacterized protein n=1 Tax=Paramecium pentaurelia TaxID=43138 RepID=A0A8S1VWA1_9CILI|nr:unnamed protein product [Paramecium pentaurelia]
MSSLLNKLTFTLRGGGCGSIQIIPNTDIVLKSDIQDIENFITRFDSFVQTIYTKAAVAANQLEAQEIMIARQWFIFEEESIYKLIKNAQKVMKSYNLIIDGILKLLKSCLIYIRTDQFKCLFILRTTVQQYFDFIISDKLLALIQKNDERLGVIVKIIKILYKKINIIISQKNNPLIIHNQKNIILNFKEYFQNTIKIIKIKRLSLRKQDLQLVQLEQKKINEFKIFQQLRYIMRLLESILLQTIQDINDQRNEPDESIMFQQEIELIKEELQNLDLADKQFSFANKFKQKLLAFPNATLNKNSFLKDAQCMLKLIEKTEKQVSELETLLLKKDNLIQYFQSLLNNLNFYYEKQIQELQKYFNELLQSFKTILMLQYEIESVSLPEKLIEIKQQYCISFHINLYKNKD